MNLKSLITLGKIVVPIAIDGVRFLIRIARKKPVNPLSHKDVQRQQAQIKKATTK